MGLAVDSSCGKVYCSTRGSSIYAANLDGSNGTTLVTHQTTVHGIAIDGTAGRLYWADWLRNMGLAWMPAP